MNNNVNVNGTNEWAVKTVNCCTGCSNNCRYCYARGIGLRFKRTTYEDWENCQTRQKDVDKRYPKYNGRVMFPSSHDITPNNFQACYKVLGKLLEAGNEVLVVSKPYVESIRTICIYAVGEIKLEEHLKCFSERDIQEVHVEIEARFKFAEGVGRGRC